MDTIEFPVNAHECSALLLKLTQVPRTKGYTDPSFDSSEPNDHEIPEAPLNPRKHKLVAGPVISKASAVDIDAKTSLGETVSHVAALRSLPLSVAQQACGAYLSTFEISGKAYPADDLVPSAVDVLPGVHAAVAFDVLRERGIDVLGICPAHVKRGKYIVPVPDNPPRIYAGPLKPPNGIPTPFSPPLNKTRQGTL